VTGEDTPLIFSSSHGNAISISDADAGTQPVIVTISATNGTISLGSVTGLTFGQGDGADDVTMTFVGTVSEINAALDGVSFRPNPEFNGSAMLQITVDDQGNVGSGGAKTDLDAVDITVIPVNDSPVATGESYVVDSDDVLNVAAPGLLANDTDIEGDPLTVTMVRGPASGTLSINGDGSFSYTPTTSYQGTDTFTYVVEDGSAISAEVTVTIEVSLAAGASRPVDDGGDATSDDGSNADSESNSDADSDSDANSATDSALDSEVAPGDSDSSVADERELAMRRDRRPDSRSESSPAQGADSQGTASSSAGGLVISMDLSDAKTAAPRTSSGRGQQTSETAAGPQAVDVMADQLVTTMETGLLWHGLDGFREEVESSTSFTTIVAGTAATVTAALSAGYVIWMIRGGYLLASVISTLPAWRSFDPLPVLGGLPAGANAEGADQEETLSSMLRKPIRKSAGESSPAHKSNNESDPSCSA
jgi:hypothetical protein